MKWLQSLRVGSGNSEGVDEHCVGRNRLLQNEFFFKSCSHGPWPARLWPGLRPELILKSIESPQYNWNGWRGPREGPMTCCFLWLIVYGACGEIEKRAPPHRSTILSQTDPMGFDIYWEVCSGQPEHLVQFPFAWNWTEAPHFSATVAAFPLLVLKSRQGNMITLWLKGRRVHIH